MKLGVTGNRNGTTMQQRDTFTYWFSHYNKDITEFHHGDCVGVDEEICEIVQDISPAITIICHPPISTLYRAFTTYDLCMKEKDYLDRNHDIVDAVTVMWGFPTGFKEIVRSGTWATIRYAKRMNKELFVAWPDGEVYEK